MRRIWFVAPGADAPWTEGRKNLVRDLVAELKSRSECPVIIGGKDISPNSPFFRAIRASASGPSTPAALLSSYVELRQKLAGRNLPDAVVVFPFGTFGGFRGRINRIFTADVLSRCRQAELPAMALLYSCVGAKLEDVSGWFGACLAVGRGASGVVPIHLGIPHKDQRWKPLHNRVPRLLFMAGYQSTASPVLESVLHERGLFDLLRCGNQIAELGATLTIAIPLLRDPQRRRDLELIIAKTCPRLEIRLLEEVDYCKAMLDYDGFIFPYYVAHSAFVPTSLLEAMSLGIPVVAADHEMYSDLTHAGNRARCLLYAPGSLSALVEKIRELIAHPDQCAQLADETRAYVRNEWTLRRSADELLGYLFPG